MFSFLLLFFSILFRFLFLFLVYFFSLYTKLHACFVSLQGTLCSRLWGSARTVSSHSLVNFFLISFLSVSSLIIVWSVFSIHRFSFPWAPFLCFSFIFLNHHSICFRWIRVKNDITLFLILSSLSSSSPFFFFFMWFCHMGLYWIFESFLIIFNQLILSGRAQCRNEIN